MLGVCRHQGARNSRVPDPQVSVYYYPTTATVATPRSLSSITCTARTTLGVTQQQQHTIVRAPVPTRLIHQSCLSPTSPRGRTCTDGARAQTAQSPTGRSRASHSQGHSGQRHCPHSPQLATRGAQTKRAVMSNKYSAAEARQTVARSKSKEAPRGRAISDRPKAKGRGSAREKEGRRALAVVPQLGSSLGTKAAFGGLVPRWGPRPRQRGDATTPLLSDRTHFPGSPFSIQRTFHTFMALPRPFLLFGGPAHTQSASLFPRTPCSGARGVHMSGRRGV